jgi:hypothetical protein
VTLTATPSTLTPAAADSNKAILTLNWTFPNYATDSANMKYIVEIDTAGKNFTGAVTRTRDQKFDNYIYRQRVKYYFIK